MNTYKSIKTIIIENLSKISNDDEKLSKYLEIVDYFLINPPVKNYDKHHILPKSIFPKYNNLRKYQWNKVLLPYDKHLECHMLLSEISDNTQLKQAFWFMGNIQKYQLTSEFAESYNSAKSYIIQEKMNKMPAMDSSGHVHIVYTDDIRLSTGSLSPISKNKISVKDKTGKTFQINRDDPRYLSGELVGVTHNTVMVRDTDGCVFRVDKNDPDYISGMLKSIAINTVVVKDKNGNIYSVSTHDSRYLSGEFKSITTGKITVKNNNGDILQIDKTDPRYLSGEYYGIAKNKVNVKDKMGNYLQVDKNDPRYLSGELVGVMKGKSWYNNGVTAKQFLPSEVPAGFVKGRSIKKS